MRAIGVEPARARRLRLGALGRRPDRHPVTVVAAAQPRCRVGSEYADESDPGPYPIPRGRADRGRPGSDGDRHVLIVDSDAAALYELFDAYPEPGALARRLGARSGTCARTRCARDGWTSADAAGLPILPGLARYDEVARGRDRPRAALHRAAHAARVRLPGAALRERLTDPSLPPMGAALPPAGRLRSRASRARRAIVLAALKRYGMIVADNGSSWYITGAPDPRWGNDDLHRCAASRAPTSRSWTPRRSSP